MSHILKVKIIIKINKIRIKNLNLKKKLKRKTWGG